MICPVCDSKLSIADSRQWEPQLRVRTYKCPKCGFKDRSFDRLEVKKPEKEPWNEDFSIH